MKKMLLFSLLFIICFVERIMTLTYLAYNLNTTPDYFFHRNESGGASEGPSSGNRVTVRGFGCRKQR